MHMGERSARNPASARFLDRSLPLWAPPVQPPAPAEATRRTEERPRNQGHPERCIDWVHMGVEVSSDIRNRVGKSYVIRRQYSSRLIPGANRLAPKNVLGINATPAIPPVLLKPCEGRAAEERCGCGEVAWSRVQGSISPANPQKCSRAKALLT